MKKLITLILGATITQLSAFGFNKDALNTRSSLGFEENRGQIMNQHGASRQDIQYSLCTPGMSVFVGNGQLHYQFYKQIENNDNLQKIKTAFEQHHLSIPTSVVTYRMDVTLVGANTNAKIIAEDPSADVANYYTGNTGSQGAIGVHHYQKVTYRDIYPGIDWVVYIKNSQLEYDFVVHPGADPSTIHIAYSGANELSIQEEGSLYAQTPLGTITEHSPYAYQLENKKKVTTKFQLQGNVLSLATETYSGTLVIDPGVDWATYYGNTSETGSGVAYDSRGYVYITGLTPGTTGIATSGSYQDTLSGLQNAFLAKFDTLGNRIWATYYGGDSSYSNVSITTLTLGESLAIDEVGNHVYMAGGTNSLNNIVTAGCYQDTLSAANDPNLLGFDAFLVEFDTAGVRQWATYLGGDSGSEGLFFDHALLVYDTLSKNIDMGITTWTDGMATTGAYQTSYAGTSGANADFGGDILITQFNHQGTRLWATYYGGPSADQLQNITIDAIGNLYITGNTFSTTGIATPNSFLPSATPQGDGLAFLAKLNNTGTSRYWGTYYGSSGETGFGVTCDQFGHVYMVGQTATPAIGNTVNTIATPGAWQTILGGNAISGSINGFLVQFDTAGNRNWGTYYGGHATYTGDCAQSVACDASGNIYFTGTTGSTETQPYLIATPGSHQDTLGGNSNSDAIIGEFDMAGHRIWATYYGGAGWDGGNGIICDRNNAVYVVGAAGAGSQTGIATPGSFQDTCSTSGSAFLVRLVPIDISITRLTTPGDTACGSEVQVALELKNKGHKAFDSIIVTTVYTNNTTGAKDSVTTTTTQWLNVNDSITLSMGNLTLDTATTYTLQTYIHHIADDSSFVDDTLNKVITVLDCINGISGIHGGSQFGVDIYPNPVNDVVAVSVYGIKGTNRIVSLTDVTGRIITQKNMSTDKVSFNISNLPSGIYLIHYKDDDHTKMTKIEKQ